MQELKVALLVDALTVSYFVHDLAEWGQRQKGLRITHAIIIAPPQEVQGASRLSRVVSKLKKGNLGILFANFAWAHLCKIERRAIARSQHSHLLGCSSLDGVIATKVGLSPQVSASGLVYRFSDEDISRIRALSLDVLIRCGSGILKGKILHAARFGIWSFHHGDNNVIRGMPAGFWEVRRRLPATGFVIQQLTEELDGGRVLFRGWFPTKGYYLLNNLLVQDRSNYYMKAALSKLALTRTLPPLVSGQPYCMPLFRVPGLLDQAAYVLDRVLRKAQLIYRHRMLGRRDQWRVAFQRGPWRSLVMWKANVIANPPGRFLADPFVFTKDFCDYCFVEDYDYSREVGEISVYELKGTKAERIGVVLSEPFHLSFPFVFEYEGKVFMIPETHQAKQIRLYEAINFPTEWKLRKVLMPQVSAADTLLIKRGDKWWLLANIALSDDRDHGSELMVFHSHSPLSDEWVPVANNPVIVDARSARNGGLVFEQDRVYRVAQKPGFLRYGKAVEFREIVALEHDIYQEIPSSIASPRFDPRVIGGHHVHSNGRYTVFDFLVLDRL